MFDMSGHPEVAKRAVLYRMVMPGHTCPYGLKARHLLRRSGYSVEDHHLATRDETDGLRTCFGALQQELGGLTLRTRSVHGHVTDVGLSDAVGAAPACGALFGH